MKEPAQPQSRLSQWTHPHSMESLSGNSSPLESNLGKHGRKTTKLESKNLSTNNLLNISNSTS